MAGSNAQQHLQRLDLIASRLKSEEPMTMSLLAEEFGVSRRTLIRDIGILRDRGLPVESDRGRGGGVRLHWSWGIGRLNLTYEEALDLLISLAIAEQMQSPVFVANLAPIRRKLVASLSPGLKARLNNLRQRILIGQTSSVSVQGTYQQPAQKLMRTVHAAFIEQKCLDVTYLGALGQPSKRNIEPQFLFLNYPVWYVLAWDRGRNAIRTLRIDRFQSATKSDESFRLRDSALFLAEMEGAAAETP